MKEISTKKINSYDLLKFIFAICIVAHHSGLIKYSSTTHLLLDPINMVSVPCFFVLSSFFFYRKCRLTGFLWSNYLYFVKRLAILYGCWLLINIPLVILRKHSEFQTSFSTGISSIIYSMFFGSTFGGSWFLTALIESTTLFFILKKMRIPGIIQIITSFIIYFSIQDDNSLNFCNVIKSIANKLFCHELSMTVCKAYFYIVIGYYLSSSYSLNLIERIRSNFSNTIIISSIILLYIIGIIYLHSGGKGFWITITTVPIILIITNCLKLRDRQIYGYLRDLSILLFFIHFIIIRIYTHFIKGTFQNGPICFITSLTISILIAIIVLKVSKHKKFKLLKYLK